MIEKLLSHFTKPLLVFCLAGAVSFSPICQANARSHHYGNTIVAAAIGGAVAGLVGGVVEGAFNPRSTVIVDRPVVVEQPVVIEPDPVIMTPVVIHRPHRYYRPVRYSRYYYRYY